MSAQAKTGCCPRFDVSNWDEKEWIWQERRFIKDRVISFFHIPLNFSKVIIRNMQKMEKAGAQNPDNLMLSDENSLWSSDLYIATDKEVADAHHATLNGTFLSKVFEGPYRDAPKWGKKFRQMLEKKGIAFNKIYFWYTTCPRCAKVYGKNYVVLFAKMI